MVDALQLEYNLQQRRAAEHMCRRLLSQFSYVEYNF